MLVRLRYLLAEGFDVTSLSGYDDASGEGNAVIMFVEQNARGQKRVRSEIFDVDSDEMEACTNLLLAHLMKRD